MELTVFTTPLTAEEIDFKIQSGKNGRTLVVPYINNRAVMTRFDQQFGWAGWSNHYQEIDGGFFCTITVTLPDGRTVSKSDAASRTGIEPIKGGVSDAMKRVAVQFGLGRSLYDYPKIYIDGEHKFIPDWSLDLLCKLVDKFNAGLVVKKMVFLKAEHAK
jgi:hypothetical protein